MKRNNENEPAQFGHSSEQRIHFDKLISLIICFLVHSHSPAPSRSLARSQRQVCLEYLYVHMNRRVLQYLSTVIATVNKTHRNLKVDWMNEIQMEF